MSSLKSIVGQFRAYLSWEGWVWFSLALLSAAGVAILTVMQIFVIGPVPVYAIVLLISAVSAAAVLTRVMGTRPVQEPASLPMPLWHVSSVRWDAHATLRLDPAHCRLRSVMARADRPWKCPRRAVWFFAVEPDNSLLSANVSRQRAGLLYQLTPVAPLSPGTVFRRGSAIALTNAADFKVTAVHQLS